MSDSPLIDAMLASMPPYICRCGRTMGVKLTVGGDWKPVDLGCQPGRCLRFRGSGDLPDAIRIDREGRAAVQVGPVHYAAGAALYDCPDGCGLWTSEPAKSCSSCGKPSPATHWDFADCCGECAGEAYGE